MSLVEELGERKIIDLIIECLDKMPNMPIPFGDDVSAIDVGNGKLAVIKTDMLVGKTDVPPGMNLWQAARKAVVMNVSDLAAKGVKPTAILASIGIPRGYTKRDIQQIGRGLNAGAREYNSYILGGDTNEASDLVISCSVLGICERQYLMRRRGAKSGDLVAVTGFFGKTASGLKIMLEKLSAPPKIRKEFINAVLMPQAKLKEGLALAKTKAVTASIDSSDGLAWSLHEISRASNVGFIIDNPPVAPEVREFAKIHDLNPLELTLYGGEEYELVVTVKRKLWEKAEKAVSQIGGALIKIGRVTREKSLLLKGKEETIPIEARGWEHFRKAQNETTFLLRNPTVIRSCGMGSLPLIDDERTFLEGATSSKLSANESVRYFEKKVTGALLDKIKVGIDVPNYPQFRDMNQMFLEMIDGVEKTKGGYMETGILSLKAGKGRIPEVSAIKKSSREIYEKIGEAFKLRICVTGPYTLSSLFVYRGSGIFTRLGDAISRIIENSLFSGKYGSVVLVAVDEPVFGLLDDPLIDYGSEGRENLRKAWEAIFQVASSKGVQTCLHLHNTADRLFWEAESLDIIESHVEDPLYHTEKTRELLESTDKFLKASICITDFDRLIKNRIVADSKQELNELSVNQKIAEAWKDITRKKLDSKIFLEDEKTMRKRLIKTIEKFGAERVPYAGPECGLRSFPTYESALECLRRVSKTVKKLQD